MKKIKLLILTVTIALSCNASFAQNSTVCDTSMCPVVPKVSGSFSSTLSKITGMNFLLSSILESQVKKQMDKALTADFKVDITPFGAKSLMEGKFKQISAHADSAYLGGFYLSNINAESLCGYNHFVYKNGEVYTNENFLMNFSAEVTSSDLQKILNTPEYMKLMNSLNINVAGMSVFKIFDPRAEVKDNRLVFSMKVMSPFSPGEPKQISTSMGLAVEEGKILFTDLQTTPVLNTMHLNTLFPIVNKLNPFVFKTNVMNNSKSIIKIQDVNFADDKIVIKGLVIVPKNYYNN